MWEQIKDYISVDECKDGYVYAIYARNSRIGIYKKSNFGFTISRVKFNDNYLFDEYHWDSDPHYGTVKPYLLLEKAPEFKNDQEKLHYLNNFLKKTEHIKEQQYNKFKEDIKKEGLDLDGIYGNSI